MNKTYLVIISVRDPKSVDISASYSVYSTAETPKQAQKEALWRVSRVTPTHHERVVKGCVEQPSHMDNGPEAA